MKNAEAILKKKQFIKTEMDKRLPAAESDALWDKAGKRLDGILETYADIPKGEHTHTDSYIFPCAAIYLTLKENLDADRAYDIIESAAIENSEKMGTMLAKLMRIPFFRSIFIRMWDPLSKKMFGPACGFQNVFYPKVKGEYRMDIISCPYNRYFTALGCPEITKIFCANDDRTYGSLPGIQFLRAKTIGRGDELCDFYVKKT